MNHSMPMSSEQISMRPMDMDLGEGDNEFDLRFIDAMIPHHRGALVMAEDLQEKSTREEMQTLAQNIIDSQQGEIDLLLQWRDQWY